MAGQRLLAALLIAPHVGLTLRRVLLPAARPRARLVLVLHKVADADAELDHAADAAAAARFCRAALRLHRRLTRPLRLRRSPDAAVPAVAAHAEHVVPPVRGECCGPVWRCALPVAR